MPDHLHGIVLMKCDIGVKLSRVMQWFKTMTTAEYFRRVHSDGWARVDRRLWQRGFYDRVIVTQQDLERIRHYIRFNPNALGGNR